MTSEMYDVLSCVESMLVSYRMYQIKAMDEGHSVDRVEDELRQRRIFSASY
jgi:hypothetical protein